MGMWNSKPWAVNLTIVMVGVCSGLKCLGQDKDKSSLPKRESCSTLADVVKSGLTHSEALKIYQAEAIIATEQYDIAKAAVMPSVRASASVFKQDESESKSRANQEAFPTTAKISVSQPIFAGGAEYAALRQASQQADAGAKLADGARIKIAKEALSKAIQVLIAQSELRSIAELRDVSRKRLRNIQGRVAIGRSKSADGLGAEAQVANSDAQFEAARLTLESARRQLSSFVGKDVESVCDLQSASSLSLKSWEDVRTKVLQRPDVLAADLSVSAAGENVAIARAGHMPAVELGGNYYLRRPESQKNSGDWDVTLSATLPIYSGGMVSSKVTEALAVEQKQMSQVRQLKKDLEDEARELWEGFSTGRAQVSSLEDAAKKSALYFQVMTNDERKGLASSLETLQALNSSIDAQRAASKAKLRFEESARQLSLVTGDLEGALR